MKTLVVALCTAGCVFALASAWSDILQPLVEAQKRAAASREVAAPRRPSSRTARPLVEADGDAEPLQQGPTRTKSQRSDTVASEIAAARITPVTELSADVEALLRERSDEAKRHEARLTMRQESLRMIYDDIRVEQATVDGIRQRATEELAVAELSVITASQGEADGQSGEPLIRRHRAETASVKSVASTATTESPAVRAAVLMIRRLVAQGSRDTAVNQLSHLKEREAAKVLAALAKDDAPLATALAIALQVSKNLSKSSSAFQN